MKTKTKKHFIDLDWRYRKSEVEFYESCFGWQLIDVKRHCDPQTGYIFGDILVFEEIIEVVDKYKVAKERLFDLGCHDLLKNVNSL